MHVTSETKKFMLTLPQELHHKIKMVAAERDVTMCGLINQILNTNITANVVNHRETVQTGQNQRDRADSSGTAKGEQKKE